MPDLGRLVLVVGPSGSGKDTLLDAARKAFADDPSVRFARRDITRPQTAGGEHHREVSVVTFEDNVRSGRYPLHWHAHQLRYGIPGDQLAPLKEGCHVIVNGSRSMIDEALDFYPYTHIISIRVSPQVLQERLVQRGREPRDVVAQRLSRATAFDVAGPYVTEIWNEGTIEEGCAAFINALYTVFSKV